MTNNATPIDYKMSKKTFDAIVKTRGKDDAKMNPYIYVAKVVNETYGLRGTVTHVTVF